VRDFNPGGIDANKTRVLVVDDNDSLRYTIARALRDVGYDVIEARSGNEALARVSEEPDLITLDVNLPDKSGIEICGLLKSNPATAHIPILQLSASFVDSQSRVRGLQGGADAYLTEPVDRAELAATVAALLRIKSAERLARQQAKEAEEARQQLAELNRTLENRVAERTAELESANRNLRELSRRLLAMQDDEHRRISRELHDGVGQLLAALSINTSLISMEADKLSDRGRDALLGNASMVDEIVRNIRTMSHLLHPPLLDEAGVATALAWYIDEFGKRSGITVTFQCDQNLGRLGSEMEIALFRIVQESLGNVLRHSQSHTAFVDLAWQGEKVSLRVRDEGIGIPSERQHELRQGSRTGVGLRGMRERVSQLGGDLEIDSSPTGTEIRILLPCPNSGAIRDDAVA
jgi:signal transduction histidine kinase